MTLLDFLIECVDTFTCTSRYLKGSFFVIIISFLLQIISLSTKGWVEFTVNGEVVGEEGLWQHCEDKGDYSCCQPLDNYLYAVNNEIPGWVSASRAFQVIGLLSGFTTVVLIILCTTIPRTCENATLKFICLGINFITAGILFLSIIIYGAGYRKEKWLASPFLSGSFGLSVCVGLFYFMNGIVLIFVIRKGRVQIAPKVINVAAVKEYPSNWDDMPKEQNVLSIPLLHTCDEYKQVAKTFFKSMIERIQIKSLYKQYLAKRDEIKQQLPSFKMSQIEKKLWHGTSCGTVESILTYGFNSRYSGKNATAFGQGVYFALNSSYSAQLTYSQPNDQGHQKMFLCRVMVGEYTVGNSSMKVPPNKNKGGHILYNSTVNGDRPPTIFVIYNDVQAYPEYLITFR